MRHAMALPFFLALGLLAISLLGCSRRAAMVTAFGESTGRSAPGIVQYYDKAAGALNQYLKSSGFSVTNHPPQGFDDVGMTYVAQRNTWYQGNYGDLPNFYVQVRQPMENAAGLNVSVCWRAEGTTGYLDSVEANANAFRTQLTEWWEHYRKSNPRLGH